MAAKDVLSNEEVDALMDTVAVKNTEQTTLHCADGTEYQRAFDMASRERFALAQMNRLSTVNERFCLQFQSDLSQAFGMPIGVELENLEVLRIEDCMAAVKDTAVLNLTKVNLASGSGLLVVDQTLLSEFINRYFGSALPANNPAKPGQPLSSTASRINQRLFQLFSSALKIGWKEVAELELDVLATETNSDFIKFGEKEELGVRFTFALSMIEFSGSIEWILPYASIEPLSSHLDPLASTENAQSLSKWKREIQQSIKEVNLDIQVVLPEFELSLKKIKQLKVGAVIPLQSPNDAQLLIENIPFYTGECGSYADKKAINLKRRVELSNM